MADRLARLEVHPDFGIILAGRVRDQQNAVARVHRVEVSVTTGEYRPVDRRAKLAWMAFRESSGHGPHGTSRLQMR